MSDFLSNLFATLIGVGIGIPVALWIGHLQETTQEKERKKRILSLLKKELTENLEAFSDWPTVLEDKINKIYTLSAYSPYESWRGFSEGGELAWVKDPELLDVISHAYFKIRAVNTISDKFVLLRENDSGTQKPAFFRFDDSVNEAKKAINHALELIDKVGKF
jgi:hypothetical protein